MSNYVLKIYGTTIADVYQLQKGENFAGFNANFFKNHQALRKTSTFLFTNKGWAVAIDHEACKGAGRIFCCNQEGDQIHSLPLKDGALVIQDLGEKHTGNQRYKARLYPVKLKLYLLENYMIGGTSVENPNHKYRGEFSAQPDHCAACRIFSDGIVEAEYEDPDFHGFQNYENLQAYEGRVTYTVKKASWVVVCRGHKTVTADAKPQETWKIELHTNQPNQYRILPKLDGCLERNYLDNFFDALAPWWSIC